MIVAFILGAVGFVFIFGIIIFVMTEETEDCMQSEDSYPEPQFKELTPEQIEDIHSRGNITPAEKVEEWEAFGLCAPGDAIGSAAWRCRIFKNCHDCLVDYANECEEEYSSLSHFLKISNNQQEPP